MDPITCDAMRYVILYVTQFKKHENHPWKITTFCKVAVKATLLRRCFSRFLNCANGTKSRKASQIFWYRISPNSHDTEFVSPNSHDTEFVSPNSHDTEFVSSNSRDTGFVSPNFHDTGFVSPNSHDTEFVNPNSHDHEQKILANRRIQKAAKHQRCRFTQKATSLMFGMFLITPLSKRVLLYFGVLEKCYEGFLFIPSLKDWKTRGKPKVF